MALPQFELLWVRCSRSLAKPLRPAAPWLSTFVQAHRSSLQCVWWLRWSLFDGLQVHSAPDGPAAAASRHSPPAGSVLTNTLSGLPLPFGDLQEPPLIVLCSLVASLAYPAVLAAEAPERAAAQLRPSPASSRPPPRIAILRGRAFAVNYAKPSGHQGVQDHLWAK